MARPSDEEITERLTDSEWRRDGDRIVRDSVLGDFGGAMGFVDEAADAPPRTPTSPGRSTASSDGKAGC